MQTENRPLPRRAASHGTLRSSYASHARPLHKPLRSVNENPALLPSPGALESMLKTTTETGDIGIFTIKPIRTSSSIAPSSKSQYHLPVRRSADDFHRQDDRRRLPSYRDTTSEILSMYGSNSQGSSVNSIWSHSINDPSQRSYSMTTVGSRPLSHNKSSNTLQSQFSGSTLQRPRSPFPYPIRLRRPGACPSSPAITESGVVDYSRMVEIDRISLRTGYGFGAPTLSRPPKRLLHSGARLDMNKTTPTLQTQGSQYAPDRQSGANSSRNVSTASETSCTLSCCEKMRSSSTRTSSLTSVINMYHRMPPTLRNVHFGTLEPPPRYYDYTEDFEFKQPFVTATVEPIAPTPTRIPSVHKSLVLPEGPEEQHFVHSEADYSPDALHTNDQLVGELEEMRDETDEPGCHQNHIAQIPSERDITSAANSISTVTKSFMSTDRGTDIDLLPSQTGRDSTDAFSPSLDMEPREARVYSHGGLYAASFSKANATSLKRQAVFRIGKTPTIHSEQGVDRGSDSHDSKSGVYEPKDGIRTLSRGSALEWRSASDPMNKHRDVLPKHGNPEHGWISLPANSHASISEQHREQAHTEIPNSPSNLEDNRNEKYGRAVGASIECAPPMTTATTLDNAGGEAAEVADEHDLRFMHSTASNTVSQRTSMEFRGDPMRHRGNMELEVITHNLQRADGDNFPRLTHECSNTPLLSPNPISPGRQLKVKNSIPQLMKALPPVPNPSATSPTSSSVVEVDDCTEILQPFSLSRSGTPRAQDTHYLQKPREISGLRHPGETMYTQTKLPRIRSKTKTPAVHDPEQRDSRPWNTESNYPWYRRTSDAELPGATVDAGTHSSGRSRIRSPATYNTSRAASSPLTETVRRYPDIPPSGAIESLTSQKPRDLFTASSRLRDAFRPTSRSNSRVDSHEQGGEDLHHSSDAINGVTPKADSPFLTDHGSGSRRLSEKRSQAYASGQVRKATSSQDMKTKRARGLEKRLSNLRKLLGRNHQATAAGKSQASEANRRSTLETNLYLENVDFERRTFTVSEGIPEEPSRGHKFRRRVRDIMSGWLKDTRRRIRAQGRGHRQKEGAK
ncbi:hypothetical protein PG999_007015 [Apiospora kogelbergensis]|uniref:Uncharacterized protein n=1 Tax=Apiospora kogelbergensis TaxID=1337665 RepID=A0AAW0QX32_9PEZI